MDTITNGARVGPIFIIGGSRTGSEMHKTILRHSPSVDLIDEACLLCPAWLHVDFQTHVRRSVGTFADDAGVDRLMELMYSKKPFGYFWRVIDRELDRPELRAAVLRSERTLRGVCEAILTVHARANGKPIRGAKFPVHYSHVETLIDWFPDCKIVHTVRDPRAVYASQFAKYVHDHQSILERAWLRLLHFAHITIQSRWTARIHRRMQGSRNYYLSRYEDMVTDPVPCLDRLCGFLGIDTVPEMLQPLNYDSSYSERLNTRGFSTDSVADWKRRLPPIIVTLTGILNRGTLRTLGYL